MLLILAGCTKQGPVDLVPEPHLTDTATTTGTTGTTAQTGDTGPAPYVMEGFSFVDEHVAGLPQPGDEVLLETDLAFLVEQEIALLVSLTVIPTDPVAIEAVGMDLLHIPIVDFNPPTLDDQVALVDAILARVAVDEKVGIHDTAGLGRCGTMLATWFVAKGMEADEAIAAIRTLRPGSIETAAQEQAVHDYADAF